jgi:hypothetical protein
MSLTKLKLGTKLWLGFGLMLVLAGIVTFIGSSRMSLRGDEVNNAVQNLTTASTCQLGSNHICGSDSIRKSFWNAERR